MSSAHYQARWLERSDEVDPWDCWPAWDIREAEDVLELSVTVRQLSESDSTHATMCIVLPSYLAPGIKPGRQPIDTWAFGD